MLTLAASVLGLFSYQRLAVDLLPHIIRPEVRIRVLEPGVPASIMEDKITRQLEEQLAITEDAIEIRSRTTEGRSAVDISFEYNKDIDLALRDASTRLDRAKRFLPTSIDPPTIYKRDPSQRPVAEFVVSSAARDPVELRTWVDHVFRKWLINIPGVAAAEVGGGMVREIQVLPNQHRIAGLGVTLEDIATTLRENNREDPLGRIRLPGRQFSTRSNARFSSIEEIGNLHVRTPDGSHIRLREIAEIKDTHEDEILRVRLDGQNGVNITIQKQPGANTVAVVDAAIHRLQQLQNNGILPEDIHVQKVNDQSIYIKNALHSTAMAAASGALLSMIMVYLFLGNLRLTLIIGSAIPVAILVTFSLMDMTGLTLNIMTLGGLAIGIGMLVDNTIVMLENVKRHQLPGQDAIENGINAAAEVKNAIIASTSTNLAAILPFLFVFGLTGLLFRELIITISSAILASMVVALTLIPSLAARSHTTGNPVTRYIVHPFLEQLRRLAGATVHKLLHSRLLASGMLLSSVLLMAYSIPVFVSDKQEFLPSVDDGRITISIATDPGSTLENTDLIADQIEELVSQQPHVESIFTTTGGFIFGRFQTESSNNATIIAQLSPLDIRHTSSSDWIAQLQHKIDALQLVGAKMRIYSRGIRGIPLTGGDDEITLHLQGPELEMLDRLGSQIATSLHRIKGLKNIFLSSEERRQELSIQIDQERTQHLNMSVQDITQALRTAIRGDVATEYLEGDRSYNILVKLPDSNIHDIRGLNTLLIGHEPESGNPVYLEEIATISLIELPYQILRYNQNRIVEINASLSGELSIGEVSGQVSTLLQELSLPPGYTIYDTGVNKLLQQERHTIQILLGLALFLVFTVLAIQYESLRNPFIILCGIPFSIIGVALGITITELTLSMPVWLGMIMLAGIVVNNTIVLLEYVEQRVKSGSTTHEALIESVQLRLRPILMTTLTTVLGLLPLSLAYGDGAEMLQPLAITIIYGLSFSMLITLLVIPLFYQIIHWRHPRQRDSQPADNEIPAHPVSEKPSTKSET